MLAPEWWNGNAMWKAMASIYNSYATLPAILLSIMGIGIVLMELLYPFLAFSKPTRKIIIPGIILMHVGIAITMDLFSFAAIMTVWNIAAFTRLTDSTETRNEKVA